MEAKFGQRAKKNGRKQLFWTLGEAEWNGQRAMATKKCARAECGKTVYPLEELNCLDKTFHKGCFKCTVCGMTLNMKNYKGYNKNPYCEPHYPKTVATVVVDTPEMKRVAEMSKYQSQHKYHEQFEKMKGTKIDIADDPETTRHLQNTKVQSQTQYHGEAEKKQKQEINRPKEETEPAKTPEPAKVGSIADYDPLNGQHGSLGSPKSPEPTENNATATTKTVKKTKKATKTTGFSVRALYDYKASDTDEISFKEGEVIVNCQRVDQGWLTGTKKGSLETGMLPANYVEQIVEKTGQARLS